MILRLFVPPLDRLSGDTGFPWALADRQGALVREGTSVLAGIPRAEAVEAILPASRVLFARLKLPRVSATTIRELLPFAVEDRLLADPAHIHAVPGRTNALGETLVAVVDRAWLRDVLSLLSRAGFTPKHAWCESALLPVGSGRWHAVLGSARNFLAEGDGMAVAFDRPAGGALPLAIRIAVDEAGERGVRPTAIGVLVEPGVAAPDAPAWSEAAGVAITVGETTGLRAATVTADAIDLLQAEFAPRTRGLALSRIPRLAIALAAAIVVLQFGLTLADWSRLRHEHGVLQADLASVFQASFPEARTIVDPVLQMRRNLADLQRSRGQAAGNDFLALATAAARSDASPARRLTYANGRLEVDRGAAP